MRRRRGPQFASVTFCLVVALAVVALSWGATHNRSASHGVGSTAQQAAARNILATRLVLPSRLVRDATFTACGATDGDACLTSTADVAGTLPTLAAMLQAAGGSLDQACSRGLATTFSSSSVAVPTFSCAVEGRLDGARVLALLGSGWQLPPSKAHASPRTAVLLAVETATAVLPAAKLAALPDALPSAGPLLPASWVSSRQPCTAAAPVLVPATSPTPSPTAAPVSPGSVLPTCTPHTSTVGVAAPVGVLAAARQLSTNALAQGFRLDGKPCVTDPAIKGCSVWGERISASGVQTLLVATLNDNGHGYMIGTVSLADQSG